MQIPIVLAALALFVSSPSPTDAVGGPTQSAATSGLSGPAHGSFTLPTPAGPGDLRGRLFGPGGTALFEVRGHVTPSVSSPLEGRIDGVLFRLVGPNPGPIAEVHGPWRYSPSQPGDFRLHVIRPGNPSQGIPPELIGRIQGRFLEPNGPLPPGGAFHAHWALHP
jgi:hypothetical protein